LTAAQLLSVADSGEPEICRGAIFKLSAEGNIVAR
jgi:hypothetical protein